MTSINPYRAYYDTSTREGIYLQDAAVNKFVNPLETEDRIKLCTADARTFIATIERTSRRFGYDFMITNVPTRRIETPGPNPGDPVVVTYGDHINMLEHFSSENIVHARKFASLIWGDNSFTETQDQVLMPLTNARGEITNHNPPRLTQRGQSRMRDRIQSSNLGFQALALLSDTARTSIELQAKKYIWQSADRRDKECDGVTVLAIIIGRLKPHYKVDLFAEIQICKDMTLAQFKEVVPDYFDALQDKKVSIDQKSATAYPEDTFIRDILNALSASSVETFAKEYESIQNKWLMGREHIVSEDLIAEATLMYTNLERKGAWIKAYSAKDQIIALTSKIMVLETKLEAAKAADPAPTQPRGRGKNNFEMWRLTKVENGEEHCKVVRGGRTYYWCEDGHSFDGKKCGMYVSHKPGAEHIAWQKKKDESKARKRATSDQGQKTDAQPKPPTGSTDTSAKKLSLSQHLKSALVTKAGLSDDQFQTIWDDACNQLGN